MAPQNSFCEQLERFGKRFNVSQMMMVDLLHGFELGVWKSLLTCLIRILHLASERPGALADIFNSRYAKSNWKEVCSHYPNRFGQITTFGHFTI
jgi:hypothetical protein